MGEQTTRTVGGACGGEPLLGFERLVVYRVALELNRVAAGLLPLRAGALRDQLDRATLGVVLNIAEGVGRNTLADKRRFFDIARGSACESAAALEVARIRRLADPFAVRQARGLAIRVVQMLTRLAPPRGS